MGDNPNASWCIRTHGRVLLRDKGEVIYSGPEADMPDDVRKSADEFTVPIEQVIEQVLCGQQAPIPRSTR